MTHRYARFAVYIILWALAFTSNHIGIVSKLSDVQGQAKLLAILYFSFPQVECTPNAPYVPSLILDSQNSRCDFAKVNKDYLGK